MVRAAEQVWQGGAIASMAEGGTPYGAIEDATLAVTGGRIAWVGPRSDLPPELIGPATQLKNFKGQWMTPGLIDCHTHLVFGGNRAAEFEARLGGVSYQMAARQGRGILSTVAATRAASEAELLDGAARRLAKLLAEGVTTVEIKSGYGLTLADELKMLRVARTLGREANVRVRTSFLGAHAVPPEFTGRSDAYLDHLVSNMLPALEGLADAVDGFAESIAFSTAQITRLFTEAGKLGLPVKLHADQLTEGGGAALAAKFGALSADHLEYSSAAGLRAMAQAGTAAVLLPGAYATVGAAQPPNIAAMRAAGLRMAVATDCNPGSSPLCSILMAMNLACSLFRLTPEEALAGITREAAHALGLGAQIGTLEPGKIADFALWEIGHPRELAYWMGYCQPIAIHRGGAIIP